MHSHRIGIATDLADVGPMLDRCDLIVVAEDVPDQTWWRSPIVSLARPGVARPGAREARGGLGVAWGPVADLRRLLSPSTLPEPVVLVVSRDAQPATGPLAESRIEWIRVLAGTRERVEVLHRPGSVEVLVFEV